MKKYLLLFLCVAAANNMFAQVLESSNTETTIDEVVEYKNVNLTWKNWFITAAGGGQVYFGDHDRQLQIKDRIAPNAEIGLGKWFTPVLGVRAMYSGLSMKGATKWGGGYDVAYGTGVDIEGKGQGTGDNLQGQKFNFGNIHVETMLNLSNLFGGYRAERFFTCAPYLGVGYAIVYDKPEKGQPAREATANIGLYNAFRLSRGLDLSLDIRGMYLNDRFDGEGGGRFGEGMWSVSMGLTYKFPARGFNTNTVVTRTITNDTELAYMREQLNQLMENNQYMQAELDRARMGGNTATAAVAHAGNDSKRVIVAPNLIVFPINQSTLSNEARANLGFMAEMIKAGDHDVVYTISGYADKGTGTPEINERLSKQRATAVYNCLIDEFGVNPKQLKLVSNGGVDNMFYDDPRLSRAVISRAEKM